MRRKKIGTPPFELPEASTSVVTFPKGAPFLVISTRKSCETILTITGRRQNNRPALKRYPRYVVPFFFNYLLQKNRCEREISSSQQAASATAAQPHTHSAPRLPPACTQRGERKPLSVGCLPCSVALVVFSLLFGLVGMPSQQPLRSLDPNAGDKSHTDSSTDTNDIETSVCTRATTAGAISTAAGGSPAAFCGLRSACLAAVRVSLACRASNLFRSRTQHHKGAATPRRPFVHGKHSERGPSQHGSSGKTAAAHSIARRVARCVPLPLCACCCPLGRHTANPATLSSLTFVSFFFADFMF